MAKKNEPERDERLTHEGFGRYSHAGVTYASYEEGAAALAELDRLAEVNDKIGDKAPEGYDPTVTDRTLIYRNSVMELPMNEPYLPDGDYSPYYDREYQWAWARRDGVAIAAKRAYGYRVVTPEEFAASIKAGTTPEHYRSLFHEDGSMLTYGDSVLMRIPRLRVRQLQAEKAAAAKRQLGKVDEQQYEAADRLGMQVVETPIKNSVSSGLKVSGF